MAARLRDLAITNVPFPEHAAVSRDDHSCRLRQVLRGIVLAVYDSDTSPNLCLAHEIWRHIIDIRRQNI